MRRAVGFVALAAVAAVVTSPIPSRANSDDPLEDARKAAATTSFSGHVVVRWHDGSAPHQEDLDVRGKGGAFIAEGERQAMAMGNERLVHDRSDGWHELWPTGLGQAHQPDIDVAYDIRHAGAGDPVADKPTVRFELFKGGVKREVLALDADTNLLLSRKQYDARGQEGRSFEFTRVSIPDPVVTAPTIPPAPKHDGPEAIKLTSVSGGDRAPSRLASGFQRLGVYRVSGGTQFLYGDGLYALSLFEQPGRVKSNDLPEPRRSAHVDGRQAWQFSWAGGEGLVWTAGPTVYTLVGDVPADELMVVANSVPVHRSTSIVHRVRQVCRELVQSFTGGR